MQDLYSLGNLCSTIAIFFIGISLQVNNYTSRTDREVQLLTGYPADLTKPTWISVVNVFLGSLGTFTCLWLIVLNLFTIIIRPEYETRMPARMLVLSITSFIPNSVFIYADLIFTVDTVTLEEGARFAIYLTPIILNMLFVCGYTIYITFFFDARRSSLIGKKILIVSRKNVPNASSGAPAHVAKERAKEPVSAEYLRRPQPKNAPVRVYSTR